jgi:hypothetical protein
MQPPVYNPDPAQYDRILEGYIGINIPTYDMSSEEMQQRLNRAYTVQVSPLLNRNTALSCVNRANMCLCYV